MSVLDQEPRRAWNIILFVKSWLLMNGPLVCTACAICGLFTQPSVNSSYGEVVHLKPAADTSLFETSSDNNLGGNQIIPCGTTMAGEKSRALYRFDIGEATIPAGAVITNAALTLRVVKTPQAPAASSVFGLHRILQPWIEGATSGNNNGSLAQAGEPTWNNRAHPSTPWSVKGAAAPVDYTETVSASALIDTPGLYDFGSTPALVADVQAWLNEPTNNFGWILISEDEATPRTARRFTTRASGTDAPVLQIGFTTLPPVRMVGAQVVSNQFVFKFDVQGGHGYDIQFREVMASGPWLVLTNIQPATTAAEIIVTDSVIGRPQRCYRVQTQASQ